MNKKNVAIKVGIFLTVIMIMFVVGQLWLMRFNVGKDKREMQIFFNDVSGLKLGDPVRVYGIKKGKVTDMKMRRDGVMVTVIIEEDIKLKEDARASIQDVAMISGTKTIVINPGTSEEPLDLSEPLMGEPNLGLSTVELGTITTKVEDLIEILQKGIGEGSGAIKNLEMALKEVQLLLRESRGGIKEALEKGNADLEEARVLMSDISDATNELTLTLEYINSKKGSMGKFIYDDSLYNNMKNASRSLDNLLRDIKENPERYINISVF